MRPSHHEDSWKLRSDLMESNQFLKIDRIVRRPLVTDVQETRPHIVLFNFCSIDEFTRYSKIFHFLMSRASEVEIKGLESTMQSDMVGLEEIKTYLWQRSPSVYFDYASRNYGAEDPVSLIYPKGNYAQNAFEGILDERNRGSKFTVDQDGLVFFTGPGSQMKDVLSVVSELCYPSQQSGNWRKQTAVIPNFHWVDTSEVQATHGSCIKLETLTVAPLKSPEGVKLKPSPKKKNGRKANKERDLYKRNYFHACENLLSLMINKKQNRKTAILSLKKSGPEVPQLLTQFSASIAGTGLAILFSVICKVGCGKAPFCAYKLLNTGFGFGLVWLSWAVNRLRETVVLISKTSGKAGLKEEEMLKSVNRSINEIFFRAAALMAVAVFRLA